MIKNQQWFIFELINGAVGPSPPPTEEFRVINATTQEVRVINDTTQEERIT